MNKCYKIGFNRNIVLLCIIISALLSVAGFLLFMGINKNVAKSLYDMVSEASLGAIVTQTIFLLSTSLLVLLIIIFLSKIIRLWNEGNENRANVFVDVINRLHPHYIILMVALIGLINICFESLIRTSTLTLVMNYIKDDPQAANLMIFNDVVFGLLAFGFIVIAIMSIFLKMKIVSYLRYTYWCEFLYRRHNVTEVLHYLLFKYALKIKMQIIIFLFELIKMLCQKTISFAMRWKATIVFAYVSRSIWLKHFYSVPDAFSN